ncbi:MAG: protein kinase [Vicinamibacterales bacterium]
MPFEAGTRLGPYEIVAPVGAGGMGEVYRAHDVRLERDVAVKVLPAAFSSDPERLARFEQEARAVAGLSHPNILAVYDIGQYRLADAGPSVPYIVSELLEGQTLRERLEEGPQSVRKAIEYGVQIADGLAAAHDKRIAHRDLKPENIFITRDDRVKILDFGLAKLTEREPATSGGSGGRSSAHLDTIPGIVLGTVGYMAPEQVRGQQADHHADIFAFGAVLYEMLSGQRAFGGHFSEALNAILKEHPPDLTTLMRHMPPALDRIVNRCLEKSADARFHSAGDLAFALKALSGDTGKPRAKVPGVETLRAGGGLVWAGTIAVGVGLVAILSLLVAGYVRGMAAEDVPVPVLMEPAQKAEDMPLPPPVRAETLRFAIAPPAGWAATGGLSISPDGRLVAIAAKSAEGGVGQSLLWIRSLDTLAARSLPGTDRASGPFWSPDSKFVGFFADGKLKRVDVSGGSPVTMGDAGASATNAAWSRDGVIVFLGSVGGSSGLFKVAASGGVPVLVTKVAPSAWAGLPPTFLPGGQRVLSSAASAKGVQAYVTSLDSGTQTAISPLTVSGPVLYSQGHVIFARETVLMAQRFDPDTLTVSGEPFLVAELAEQGRLRPSGVTHARFGAFSVSETGVLAYLTEFAGGSPQLTWFNRSDRGVAPIGDRADYGHVELSPGGKSAALSVADPVKGSRDLWVLDLTRGVRSRLTFDASDEDSAVWSPDGSRIVFRSSRNRYRDLFQRASDGTGASTELFADDHNKTPVSWSPDGKFILFASDEGGGRLWVLPLAGNKKPLPLHETTFREAEGQFSPGSDWIAYVSNESGRDEVYVMPFPGPGARLQISMAGGSQPRWRRDGKEIFFLAPNNKLMAAAINIRGSKVEASAAQPLFDVSPAGTGSTYAVSADGQRFLVNTADAAPAPTITVVVNWLPRPLALRRDSP